MSDAIERVDSPVSRAMVFVCEKCGRRAGGSGKNPSHRLASKFKRLTKHEFEKGMVRVVLTSCMDVCPDDRIAVCVHANGPGAPAVWVSTSDDPDAGSEALMKTVLRLLKRE